MQWRPRGFAPRLALIVALGLAVRVAYALIAMRHVTVTGDGNEFHGLAQMLADRGRYVEPLPGPEIPTAEKPPLWPLVLALPAKLGLDTFTAQRLIECLVGAGTVAVRDQAPEHVEVVRVARAAQIVRQKQDVHQPRREPRGGYQGEPARESAPRRAQRRAAHAVTDSVGHWRP